MKKAVIVGLVVFVVLAVASTASAGGWAGSRYDKSECTYTKESNFLYCESTFTVEQFRTEQMAFPDASCLSGTRLVRRTGWFVEVWRVFDGFTGHVPVWRHNLFGNEVPLLGLEHWRDYTDTDLGCL